MSTEDNIALVRRFNASMRDYWRGGDERLFDDFLAPDYVQHWPGFPSSRRGYLDMLAVFRVAFPDLAKTTEDIFGGGDRVVDRVSVRATHLGEIFGARPTGLVVTLSEIHIARIAGGRIVERWGEWDLLGLMRQIGAPPRVGQEAGPRSTS